MLLSHLLDRLPFYILRCEIFTHSDSRESSDRRGGSVLRLKKKSVLYCGGLLWIISVRRIKRLIGGFGWFMIVIIKSALVSVIDKRAKKFKVSKYFVNICWLCS